MALPDLLAYDDLRHPNATSKNRRLHTSALGLVLLPEKVFHRYATCAIEYPCAACYRVPASRYVMCCCSCRRCLTLAMPSLLCRCATLQAPSDLQGSVHVKDLAFNLKNFYSMVLKLPALTQAIEEVPSVACTYEVVDIFSNSVPPLLIAALITLQLWSWRFFQHDDDESAEATTVCIDHGKNMNVMHVSSERLELQRIVTEMLAMDTMRQWRRNESKVLQYNCRLLLAELAYLFHL